VSESEGSYLRVTWIRGDFNDWDDDGLLCVSLADADHPKRVTPGATVGVRDGDGNAAEARVVDVSGRGLVRLSVHPHTWSRHR
jgi:hypothetical protein